MGLFSIFKDAYSVASAQVHGETLAKEIEETMKNISSAAPHLQLAIATVFLKERTDLLAQKATWSKVRQVELGRAMQIASKRMDRQARSDADLAEGYGLWLAGAWLEAGGLTAEPAQIAYRVLEQMCAYAQVPR